MRLTPELRGLADLALKLYRIKPLKSLGFQVSLL